MSVALSRTVSHQRQPLGQNFAAPPCRIEHARPNLRSKSASPGRGGPATLRGRSMRGNAKRTALIALIAGLPLWAPGVANANEPDAVSGSVTGGEDASPATTTLDPDPQAAQKLELAGSYFTMKYGAGSAAEYNSQAQAYAAAYGGDGSSAVSGCDPGGAHTECETTIRVLNLEHIGQAKNYYCGPATGVMILRFQKQGRSAANGATLDQASVAGLAHMETDKWGKTRFWPEGDNPGHQMRKGLNQWREGTNRGYYVDEATPSVTEFKKALIYDIDRASGYPFAVETLEEVDGPHYNGHPSTETIGHWITAFGYRSSGDGTHFADPATTVWSAVNPKFRVDTSTFVNRYLQVHGITW